LETPVQPKAAPKKEEPVGPQRTLAKLKELSQFLLKAENKATQPPLVADLYRKAQEFAASEAVTDGGALQKVANSLVVFLKELCDLPQAVTPSSIRTVHQTVMFLEAVSKQPPRNGTENPDLFKVLVVDDEAVARRVIKGSLGLVQLTPDSAKDPIEALDLARTRRYDLFVLDVNMPVMTGYDLCERLRKSMEYEQTPVIFVTAWNTFESRLRFARSGGDDFIAKPFLPTELAAKTLIHLLGRRMGLSKV
jgi:CheY-like chemotaxis protein